MESTRTQPAREDDPCERIDDGSSPEALRRYAILQPPDWIMAALAAMLKVERSQGKISKIGLAYVNDLLGIEMNANAGNAFKCAGLEVVGVKSYISSAPRTCRLS